MRIVVLGAPGRHLRGNASSCGRSGRVHFRVMDGHRDHGCAGIPPGIFEQGYQQILTVVWVDVLNF